MTGVGWGRDRTAHYYEEFDRQHDRYRRVNDELAARAALEPGQRVLDLGAGLGGTARAALARLEGADCRIVCCEPQDGMRSRGQELLADPRVTWTAGLPAEPEGFDRVLCGAAIWQVAPLPLVFEGVAALLAPGGALAFTIPSLYLGEPDEPGGGSDPHLLELVALLSEGREPAASPGARLPDAAGIDLLLSSAGLRPERWRVRVRLTQEAHRDLLKIPVLTDRLLAGLAPDERAARIDEAYERVDPHSWRWEGWSGWTAWKPR